MAEVVSRNNDALNLGAMCEICKSNTAKYRCPGCFTLSCCVKCVKQHKIDNQCEGVKDNSNLTTDEEFIEDFR